MLIASVPEVSERPPAVPPVGLNVLQVGMGWLPWSGGGGVERYFHGLVGSLESARVRTWSVVQGTSRPDNAQEGVISAASTDSPMFHRVAGVWTATRRLTSAIPMDLVASHFSLYGLPARFACGLPHVVHFHGPWAMESEVEGGGRIGVLFKRRIERTVYRSASRILAVSKAFAGLLVREYGIPEHRVRVVGAGVDLHRFRPGVSREEARNRLRWPSDRPVILTVRRLVRRTGVDQLINAMRSLVDKHRDVLLMIAGDGHLAAELTARISSLGLERNVQLSGRIPEQQLPLAYRAADVSVMPSVALEGFGLSAAESLASGTPVVVTPVGGLPEVVEDLSPELVVDGIRPGDLAARLGEWLEGRVRLPNASDCRRFAEERFCWSKIASSVRAVYEEAISSGR